MKKSTILFFIGFLLVTAANAQELKKFRVGVGGGYAMPGGTGAKGGVLFYLEPGYRINDNLLVNLRMEFAAMARGTAKDYGSGDFDISTSGSYTVNAQYYLKPEGFRPFVGAGFGFYSIKAAKVSDAGYSGTFGKDESKIGFYPRVGFDAGHFQLSLDYNLVAKSSVDVQTFDDQGNIVTESVDFKNSYLGIRFGVTIGGGKK
jgi:outer membrane protein W